jgi:carotenoid cleavage dioxygenase-like enzyme
MSEQNAVEESTPSWLEGNFAPVFDELTETELRVTGTIPEDLNGRLLRNGPNPATGESPNWFLGHGMIHGVELKGGKVNWYRNRFVQTPMYHQKDRDVMEGIGNLVESVANTHIIRHAGRLLALEELHLPYEVSPMLDTIGVYDFDGKLKTGMTAHPKICASTGELLAFSYNLEAPFMTYHRVSATGELVQTEAIDVKGPTMVHDFNITENYVVFMDLPFIFDFEGMEEFGMPFRWCDEYGARLGVMPRNGSNADVVWYDIDPCYVFHAVNAYEEDGNIIVDVCRQAHFGKPNVEDPGAQLFRWAIDTNAGTVSETQLGEHFVDFPVVHPERVGLKNRYAYMGKFSEEELCAESGCASAFLKHDFETGESSIFSLSGGRRSGEPIFVPARESSAEDDGYLLGWVYDPELDASEVVILDASGDLDKQPLARIHLPTRVPHGFHGSWIADPA